MNHEPAEPMRAADAPALRIDPPAARGVGAGWRGLAALAFVAWLGFAIGLHPLTLPEEGRYVGVAWEMLRSGHWLVPTEDGLPFFHKPPLFYWLTAASMRLFGGNEAAARAAPLAAACLAAAGFHWVLRRRAGRPLADATMAVLATLPFFFAAAQFANLDMLVAAFIALAIVFAAEAALAVRDGAPQGTAIVLAWSCAALGVLAKGLIGVVLPGLVMVVWLIVSGQMRTILRLLSPLGIALFALIAAPWFLAVQQQFPGFARYFFVYQHFERFTAGGFNNPQPWWFYVVAVPLLTLPWSLWLVRVRVRGAAGDNRDRRDWRLLMWTWLGTVIVFFSLPQSKPVGYAMPVLFPLAFLIAEPALAAWRGARSIPRRLVMATFAVAVAICVAALAWMALRYDHDNAALAGTLAAMRAPGDPIVFVDEYFFDIPLYARLAEPVPVISDWHDPAIAERDNWRRELAEAAPFAPALGAALLVDARRGYALRCGNAPLWVVTKLKDEPGVAAQPASTRVFSAHGASLWRLAPQHCDSAAAATPASRP
jgi:4-amino-4-deoxy-L-arabinose transferase-like glycosyltransferase